mmetsp:Transcript_4360/g.13606  ORF Transcript_4360/g.13606 Transcript_4360/m.13606 type:complete len:562 (-) Transcript_4360:2-1687(-)
MGSSWEPPTRLLDWLCATILGFLSPGKTSMTSSSSFSLFSILTFFGAAPPSSTPRTTTTGFLSSWSSTRGLFEDVVVVVGVVFGRGRRHHSGRVVVRRGRRSGFVVVSFRGGGGRRHVVVVVGGFVVVLRELGRRRERKRMVVVNHVLEVVVLGRRLLDDVVVADDVRDLRGVYDVGARRERGRRVDLWSLGTAAGRGHGAGGAGRGVVARGKEGSGGEGVAGFRFLTRPLEARRPGAGVVTHEQEAAGVVDGEADRGGPVALRARGQVFGGGRGRAGGVVVGREVEAGADERFLGGLGRCEHGLRDSGHAHVRHDAVHDVGLGVERLQLRPRRPFRRRAVRGLGRRRHRACWSSRRRGERRASLGDVGRAEGGAHGGDGVVVDAPEQQRAVLGGADGDFPGGRRGHAAAQGHADAAAEFETRGLVGSRAREDGRVGLAVGRGHEPQALVQLQRSVGRRVETQRGDALFDEVHGRGGTRVLHFVLIIIELRRRRCRQRRRVLFRSRRFVVDAEARGRVLVVLLRRRGELAVTAEKAAEQSPREAPTRRGRRRRHGRRRTHY